MEILLEQLTHDNYDDAAAINRDDIPEDWVDNASFLMEVTDYGAEHHLIGHTYLARVDGKPAGLIMIGEALAWETDPEEMQGKPFYRVMGFVVDRAYPATSGNRRPCGDLDYISPHLFLSLFGGAL